MAESSKGPKIDFFDPDDDRTMFEGGMILAFTFHQMERRMTPTAHLDEERCKCNGARLARLFKERVQNLDIDSNESH